MEAVDVDAGPCLLRRLRDSDLDSMVLYSNDCEIWLKMRDRFPHPYSREHGENFIRQAQDSQLNQLVLAIDVGGTMVGVIGLHPGEDVRSASAEIGYWIAKPYWGRGLATAALTGIVGHAFRHFNYCRLYAHVFEGNRASERVLEKCGFVREAVLRRAILKAGELLNASLFARIDETVAARVLCSASLNRRVAPR